MSELALTAETPGVITVDAESSTMSDTSKNCSSIEPVEHSDSESMQCQPTVLPGLEEGTLPERPDADIREKSEVEPSSSQLTVTDVSEQLAVLHNTIGLLKTSNEELRLIVSDGMTKVTELEAAYAVSVARNKELEQELARLSDSNLRTVSDVALLSTSLAQISARIDVKATPADSDGSGAAAAPTDVSSLLPTIEQRVGELEVQLLQSTTRFGEFASALDSIEHDFQRYIRRHSLVVESLSPKEDRSASDAFLIFVNSVLGVTVDDSDIDGYHLLDRMNEDGANAAVDKMKDRRPRPLLITFTCYRTRTQVYKAWLCHRVGAAGGRKAAAGSLSGERGHGVCIREYLTASQEAVYRKADETRHRRPDVIVDCWTFRGRTFVRTSQDEVREFHDADQFCSKDSKTSSCAVM